MIWDILIGRKFSKAGDHFGDEKEIETQKVNLCALSGRPDNLDRSLWVRFPRLHRSAACFFGSGRRSPIAQDCFSRSWDRRCVLSIMTITTTAIPVFSSSVVCIFNGACFGPCIGFLMNLCGTSLGNLCMWLFFTRYDLPKRSQRLEEFIAEIEQHKQKIYGILAGYMMPMFPSFIVNYVSVHLKLSVSTAISCIVIGMVPTSFIYAFGGNAIFEGSKTLSIGALAGFVILFSVVFIYRKWRKQRKNNA